MDSIDDEFSSEEKSIVSPTKNIPLTDTEKDDLVKEIKTTNELLKIIIDRMDEILVYLEGKTTTSSL